MKLAIVTPWPSDRSGIADYSYDLVTGLIKLGMSVTVFTLADKVKPLEGCEIINSDCQFWALNHFDEIIYHFGNNLAFHYHMYDLLKKHQGIVHLHDFVLHHLVAGLAQKHATWPEYFSTLTRYYGPELSSKIKEGWDNAEYLWEGSEVVNFPMNEDIIAMSKGVITHSEYAKNKTHIKFPFKSVAKLPQVYNMAIEPSKTNKGFVLGVFGHVQPNKCLDVLLKSLASVESHNKTVVIRVVGAIADEAYHKKLLALLKPIKSWVSFESTGYVSDDEFIQQLNDCDLCIALRNPTMGETSAVVMRAIQLHTPAVVTDIGWYSELPEFVYKIQASEDGIQELSTYLKQCLSEPNFMASLQKQAKIYCDENLSFESVCHTYTDILWEFKQNTGRPEVVPSLNNLSKALYDLNIVEINDKFKIRNRIYGKVVDLL